MLSIKESVELCGMSKEAGYWFIRGNPQIALQLIMEQDQEHYFDITKKYYSLLEEYKYRTKEEKLNEAMCLVYLPERHGCAPQSVPTVVNSIFKFAPEEESYVAYDKYSLALKYAWRFYNE